MKIEIKNKIDRIKEIAGTLNQIKNRINHYIEKLGFSPFWTSLISSIFISGLVITMMNLGGCPEEGLLPEQSGYQYNIAGI